MFRPIESARASFAPRLAASIDPGPPPVITASPASPASCAVAARQLVLGVVARRARRAEDRHRRAHVRQRVEAHAQLLLDPLQPRLVGERGEDRRLLGGEDLLVEGGGRARLGAHGSASSPAAASASSSVAWIETRQHACHRASRSERPARTSHLGAADPAAAPRLCVKTNTRLAGVHDPLHLGPQVRPTSRRSRAPACESRRGRGRCRRRERPASDATPRPGRTSPSSASMSRRG